jgi:hypothetical protein
VLLILWAVLALAQEDHSQHQHAVAGLGTVDFPTSCNATAQELVSRGAALLHSFGYEEARITFNDAAKSDPTCAMAYWGVARTWYHPIWAPPSPDELKQGAVALDRAINAKTDRERDYINALAVFYKDWQTVDHATRAKNYEQALGAVCDGNPSDDEAAIFSRCSWWRSVTSTRRTSRIRGRRRVSRFLTSCWHAIRTILAWRTTSFTA